MVYRNYHEECKEDCTRLVAYVRIDGKFTKIGHYGSACKEFEPLDLQKEKQDRKLKHRVRRLTKLVRNAKNMSLEDVENQIKHFDSDVNNGNNYNNP